MSAIRGAEPTVASIECSAMHEGMAIERYRLSAGAFALEFMTLGCVITRLETPDTKGDLANVVLDHAEVGRYAEGREYFGAVIGRVANRVRDGRLRLDGREYRLSTNDGPHHLHGGTRGFDRRLWRVVTVRVQGEWAMAELELVSAAGEEGYPGELKARVRYSVRADGEVDVRLSARTRQATVVNLTNHSYFNLQGEGDVRSHELTIHADRFCIVDSDLLPTGELRSVTGTAFDFRQAKLVGRDLAAADLQLQLAGGFDHCMVLTPSGIAGAVERACMLFEPVSGRRLEVWTDQPGVQLYSGNFLDGSSVGASGRRHDRHAGLCLETQRFPDAPNQPSFPSVQLQPDELYSSTTRWRFSA